MDVQKYKEIVIEITEFLDMLKEEYREKAFEFFIKALEGKSRVESNQMNILVISGVTLPPSVVNFLHRFNITSEDIQQSFSINSESIDPVHNYSIEGRTHPDIHLELACLLSFQNALLTGRFEFLKEDLRAELNRRNGFTEFLKNLRRRNEFYYDTEVDPVRLSNRGFHRLAELIHELAES